jgi:capsular exopolysaccharide synthesis family protein
MAEYPKIKYTSSEVDDSFNFAKFLRILRKRWKTIAVIAVTVSVGNIYYTFTRTPEYLASASLLVNSTIAVSEIQIPGMSSASSSSGLNTEVAILKSRTLLETAIAKLQRPDAKQVYNDLNSGIVADALDIRTEKDTMVLRLRYRDTNPKRARDVLNALSDTYVEYSLNERRGKTNTAIQFIQEKLPEVKKQLDKSALAVTQFRKAYNIVDPDTYAASVYKMRETLESRAQELQITLAQTQEQYAVLRRQVGKPADEAIAGAILQQDTPYQSLVKQFQEAETNYFLERTRFQEDYPSVVVLRDRRDELYRLLETRAQALVGDRSNVANIIQEPNSAIQQDLASELFTTQTTLAVSQAQLESVRNAQTEVANAFAKIPQIQQQYVEIQRQLALDSATYNKLADKLEELRIANAQEVSSWRVLEPPLIPAKPFSPDIGRNLVTGTILGLSLGVLLAMLQNRLDERVHEVEEVRELIDIPLLASIPMTNTSSFLPVGSHSIVPSTDYYAFKEALSSLALNLRYLGADNTVKVIAMTSSVPSEGKSTLNYNLCMMLAALGHRVLLIDADLRKPTIHKLSARPNKNGLSTALVTSIPWQDLVQKADGNSNLHILTAGSIPPNPMLLLDSDKMTTLLQECRQEYDYVLVDTPPVVGITDALCLASKVDAFILVAAIDRSTRSGISRALEVLSNASANVVGVLINMVGASDSQYYYSSYNSYYLKASESQDDDADVTTSV